MDATPDSSVPSSGNSLEKNRAAFNAAWSELMAEHEGKFALVSEEHVVETFDTMEAAYTYALEEGLTRGFYIGRVTQAGEVKHLPALMHGLLDAYL